MKQSLSTVQAQGAFTSQLSHVRIFGILLILFGSALPLAAQQWESIPVDSFTYQITTPNGAFSAGDTVEFTIQLGTASTPVADAAAFDLAIDLSSYARVPANPTMDLTQSWLIDDGHFESNVTHDASSSQLLLEAERTDQNVRTGGGELLRFQLIADVAVASGAQLLEASGGMVMIENLDMKTVHEVERENGIRLYPQPARDHVFLELPEQEGTRVEILGLGGRLLHREILSSASIHRLDLSSFSSPCLLVVHFPGGQVSVRKLFRLE